MNKDCLYVDFYKKEIIEDITLLEKNYPFKIPCKYLNIVDKFGSKIYAHDEIQITDNKLLMCGIMPSGQWHVQDYNLKKIVYIDPLPSNEFERIGNIYLTGPGYMRLHTISDSIKIIRVKVLENNTWEVFRLVEEKLKKLTDRQKKVIDFLYEPKRIWSENNSEFKPYLEVETYTDQNVFQAISAYADKLGYK